LSAGGVADEWVTQLLRQGDAKVFKKYSQRKLQMKREALAEAQSRGERVGGNSGTGGMTNGANSETVDRGFGTVLGQFSPGKRTREEANCRNPQ
jgi:hypothetical protein